MKDLSRFLSFILRHAPQSIGLTLDAQGWADIDTLLAKAAAGGRPFDRAALAAVVEQNDKKRFTLSADGCRIRAAQGHSVDVDLGLAPTAPPPTLYHGTATRFLGAVMAEGLKPGSRQKVHLSADQATARAVGRRHGKPVVLRIDTERMRDEGHEFWQAENAVWLTDSVPPRFLALEA
jgi:putative RNA 2'-phosphotransferase